MSPRTRLPLRTAAAFAAGVLVWATVARGLVPARIRAAYPADAQGLLEDALGRWDRFTGMVTLAALAVILGLLLRARIRPWVRREPAVPASGLISLAVAIGLAGGLMEAMVPVARGGLSLQHAFFMGTLWMTGFAAGLGFFAVASVLTLAARAWRRPVSLHLAVALFGGLAIFGLLRTTLGGLHPAAATLFAAGLGVQAARLAAPRRAAVTHLARRAAVALAGIVLVLGVSANVAAPLVENRQLALLPAPPARAPNIVLLILDTVRARSLEAYGYVRDTGPRLAGLARQGVFFDQAIAPSSWTLPSHGSMFTGRQESELDVSVVKPLDTRYPTIAEALTAYGYATGGFVGNLWYAARPHGLARGFSHYEDYRPTPTTIAGFHWLTRAITMRVRELTGDRSDLGRPSAASVNRRFLRWAAKQQRPFFAFLNYFDAHHPYATPSDFERRFTKHQPRYWLYDGPARPYAHWELHELRDAYDETIAYTDAQLGVLLDSLAARGVLDNTVVIVTSDHGELLGEKGLINHGNSLYLPLVHVPLVIAGGAGVPGGAQVTGPVSLRDMASTIAAFAGLEDHPFPGASLQRFWAGGEGASHEVLAELGHHPSSIAWGPISRGDMSAVIARGKHYIRNGDGVEELYDITRDPDQQTDLAPDPAYAGELARFRTWLAQEHEQRSAALRPAVANR